MKQLAILLFSIALYTPVMAQKDSIYVWNKWCSRRDTPLLFTGSYNIIEVYCQGMKPGDFYLKSLDKTLKISGDTLIADTLAMLAMPYTTEQPMRLAIMSKKGNKMIKTVLFNGADVPAPMARLGYVKDSIAPKDNILAQVGLKVYFPNSCYSYPYHVKSFTLKTKYDKLDIKLAAKNHLITRDMEQAVTKAPPGTLLEYTDIKATCPDCVTRTLKDLRIYIKKK